MLASTKGASAASDLGTRPKGVTPKNVCETCGDPHDTLLHRPPEALRPVPVDQGQTQVLKEQEQKQEALMLAQVETVQTRLLTEQEQQKAQRRSQFERLERTKRSLKRISDSLNQGTGQGLSLHQSWLRWSQEKKMKKSFSAASSKLFHFDPDVKQWKERGTGEIKILKHKTRKAFRIISRQDGTLKLTCNHLINKDMKLEPVYRLRKCCCTWFAMDYIKEEGSMEKLAAKFDSIATKEKFIKAFQDCQRFLA